MKKTISLNEFIENTENYANNLDGTLMLLHNGEERLVVMDIASYKRLYELAQAAALKIILTQREQQTRNEDLLTADEVIARIKNNTNYFLS